MGGDYFYIKWGWKKERGHRGQKLEGSQETKLEYDFCQVPLFFQVVLCILKSSFSDPQLPGLIGGILGSSLRYTVHLPLLIRADSLYLSVLFLATNISISFLQHIYHLLVFFTGSSYSIQTYFFTYVYFFFGIVWFLVIYHFKSVCQTEHSFN